MNVEQLKAKLTHIITTRFAEMMQDPAYLRHESIGEMKANLKEWLELISLSSDVDGIKRVARWWDADLDLEA